MNRKQVPSALSRVLYHISFTVNRENSRQTWASFRLTPVGNRNRITNKGKRDADIGAIVSLLKGACLTSSINERKDAR